MKCEEYLESLSAYLDGIPSEDLETHLAACPACRQELESLRQSNEALHDFPSLRWTPEMTERILARTQRSRGVRWMPAAAGILLGIVTAFSLSRTSEHHDVSIATNPSPHEELAHHVAAVRLLAKQADDPPPDPAVAQAQIEKLGLVERTQRLMNSDVPPPVKDYLDQTWAVLNGASTNTVPYTLGLLATLSNNTTTFSGGSTCRRVNYDSTASNDVALYAVGRLEAANGNVAGANLCFEQLLDRYPDSRYAGFVLPSLGSYAVRNGNAVEGLAYYSSITEPTAITLSVANEIKTVSSQVGEVYVGADPIQRLDLEELRARAAARTPYVVVRTTPELGREVMLLGIQVDTRNRAWNRQGVRRVFRCGVVVDPKELPELGRELRVKLRDVRD